MDKEYIVESGALTCEYGMVPSSFKVPPHRHIFVEGEGLGNESDITAECLGDFGGCRSPYINRTNTIGFNQMCLGGVHQMVGDMACVLEVAVPWQGCRGHTKAAHFKALTEGAWTVCGKGFGILSFVSSGQAAANALQALGQKIKELEAAVDAWMAAEKVRPEKRGKLLESALLWEGYPPESVFWTRDTDLDTRNFNRYLKEKEPSLYNYFERPILIPDHKGGEVDLTYYLGLKKGLDVDRRDIAQCVSAPIIQEGSEAQYKAYADAAYLDSHREMVGKIDKDKDITQTALEYIGFRRNTPDWDSSRALLGLVPERALEGQAQLPGMDVATTEERQLAYIQKVVGESLGQTLSEGEAKIVAEGFVGRVREGLQ